MTLEEARVLACEGKSRFATKSGAHEAMKRMVRRRKFAPRDGSVLNVYRCPHCSGGWHIGNTGRTAPR